MKTQHVGLLLLALGGFSLLSSFGLNFGGYTLFILAGIFFASYFLGQRTLGLLIPACLLTSIELHSLIDSLNPSMTGSSFFFFLAGGFYAIHLIHTLAAPEQKSARWASLVGTILGIVGLVVFSSAYFNWMPLAIISNYFWPLILIGLGGYFVFSNRKSVVND